MDGGKHVNPSMDIDMDMDFTHLRFCFTFALEWVSV